MINVLSIFLAFLRIGSLAFGGAYAAMPLIEKEIVEKTGWMSFTEFSDLIAIDELTPGPIIINSATFIGMKLGGVSGAIAATIGCVLPACIVSYILINLYKRYKEIPVITEMINVLKCMSVAMILSTAIKIFLSAILPDNQFNFLALVMAIASFYLLRKTKLNPIIIMLGCGALNLLVSFIF